MRLCPDCGEKLQTWERELCLLCITFFCEICKVRHGKDYKHPPEVLDS